jgi:hypothetical protein
MHDFIKTHSKTLNFLLYLATELFNSPKKRTYSKSEIELALGERGLYYKLQSSSN